MAVGMDITMCTTQAGLCGSTRMKTDCRTLTFMSWDEDAAILLVQISSEQA